MIEFRLARFQIELILLLGLLVLWVIVICCVLALSCGLNLILLG